MGELRRRAPRAELGAEVDLELPCRPARLGERLDRHHATDPHVDSLEVLPAGDAHATGARPMTFIRRSSAFMANARVSSSDTPKSSVPSSYQGGASTPSAAGPHSTSVRWIAPR